MNTTTTITVAQIAALPGIRECGLPEYGRGRLRGVAAINHDGNITPNPEGVTLHELRIGNDMLPEPGAVLVLRCGGTTPSEYATVTGLCPDCGHVLGDSPNDNMLHCGCCDEYISLP